MEGRPQKLARLTTLRNRLPYVSQQALAAMLTVASEEELPPACTRKDIRAARNASVHLSTPYGPLHQKMNVAMTNGAQLEVEIQHPAAMLWHLCQTSSRFSDLVARTCQRHPASFREPWSVILYADEILPGNQLAYKNGRKVWGMYWSIHQFGAAALSNEDR